MYFYYLASRLTAHGADMRCMQDCSAAHTEFALRKSAAGKSQVTKMDCEVPFCSGRQFSAFETDSTSTLADQVLPGYRRVHGERRGFLHRFVQSEGPTRPFEVPWPTPNHGSHQRRTLPPHYSMPALALTHWYQRACLLEPKPIAAGRLPG